MAEKKKKKNSWMSILKRNSSSRHSMIETGSERSLDKSLEDVSPTPGTPGTVTSGSLDRLTALNSKPPKSGFFYLKPKTPPFWKPLFPNSSSSQLITTPRKSQLVQTDSPTQTPTIDFGVQAVIVGRSAHTRDVLVQTCPAWEDRPTLGDGLAEGNGNSDPNKGRETVNAASNGSGSSSEICSHPLDTDRTDGSDLNTEIPKIRKDSEENKDLSPETPVTQRTVGNFMNGSQKDGESFTPIEKDESLSNGKYLSLISEKIDAKKPIADPGEPLLDSLDKLVMEGLLCYRQCNTVFSTSENAVHPLSAVKEEFAKLNRDLEYFVDFSESAEPEEESQCENSKLGEIIIYPAFNSPREDLAPLENSAGAKVTGSKTSREAENFIYSESKLDSISSPNENEDLRNLRRDFTDPSCAQNVDEPHSSVEDESHKIMASILNSTARDTQAVSSTENTRDSVGNVDALRGEFSKFDSCDNLDELEDEIIRSLCSPVLSDPESNTELIMERNVDSELYCDIAAKQNDAEGELVQLSNLDDPDELMILHEEEAELPEPSICVTRRRLCFPLDNITEESNTDEGSVSPYRPLSWDEDSSGKQKTTVSLALTGDGNAHQTNLEELVGGNKLPNDQDGSRKKIVESNFESTNETSEVVVALPPRKAKIFVNVLEVGNLMRSLSDAPSVDVLKEAATDLTEIHAEASNNPSEISQCTEKAVSSPGSSPTANGSAVNIEILSTAVKCSEEEPDRNGNDVRNKNEDSKFVVSKTEIVLKPTMNPSGCSRKDPVVDELDSADYSHVTCMNPPPPPPPPPMPTCEDLKKVSADINNGSRSPDRNLKQRSASPVGKNAMMRELEQKFLTRQKMASDLEHITKKIAMEVNKDTTMTAHSQHDGSKTNTVYESAKFPSPKGYQKQNVMQNGTVDPWQRTYSPTSPPKSPALPVTNVNSDSKFPGQTVITDQPPPPGAVLVDSKVTVEGDKIHTDRYYALPVKEVLKEKTSTTKFIPAPEKYQGIGPTEEGIPIALRQSVKKENMSDWYKTMYKTLHKIDNNEGDTYVIGYTSDSELKKDDGCLSPKKDVQFDNAVNNNVFSNGPVSSPSVKSSVKIYNVKPGSIENYQPGHSSVVNGKENVSKRNLPDLGVPKSSYEMKDGYGSDVSFLKKQNQTNGINPEDQKVWYRQVQQGGDVPQCGLGKPAPEKPKDPVIGPPPPLPPQPLYTNQPLQYQKVSRPETLPPEYTNNGDNGLFTQNNEAYAQHMRQIIQSELQQRSYRVSSPQNNKPFRKYPEKKILAKTLFNFRAETPREISLNKGDLVYIYKELDRNWYEGECDGLVGIFPISYVEVLPPEHTKKNEIREGFAKVLYDFTAHTNVELSAKKGDEIQLIRKVDANWYEARIMGRKGIIPRSYMNVIQEPGSGHYSPAVPSMLSPRSMKDSHSSPISSPSLSLSSNVSPHSQNGHGNLRTKKGSRLIEPVLYRALYRYSPQNADELELTEGDTLYVVEMCDDGWFVGTSVRTGDVGIVPGNYLEKV